MIVVPPHISIKYYQLKFRMFRAQDLPKMDNWGTIDAYVRCDYMNKKIKTNVIQMKDNKVDWMQEIWIPAQVPLVQN